MDRLKTTVSRCSFLVLSSILAGYLAYSVWDHGCPILLAVHPAIQTIENADGLDFSDGSLSIFHSKAIGIKNASGLHPSGGRSSSFRSQELPLIKDFQLGRAIINPAIGPPTISAAA